ncbi:hypothetical protein Tco_0409383 [Tanacetum coccineum]
MYERQKKIVNDFKPMDSDDAVKDSKKVADDDTSKKDEILKEPDSTKVEKEQQGHTESTRKRSSRRLKLKATKKSKRQKTDSDLKEEEQLKAFLMIVPDEEEKLIMNFLTRGIQLLTGSLNITILIDLENLMTITEFLELMEVLDGSKPFLKWNMFEANTDDDLWKNQEEWILKSWNLYDNCGVHILMLEDGTEFYMLAERRYPLTKETLKRMLALRLIAETKSEAAFELLRFIQKQIDESESHNGGEKDLHQELASPEANSFCKELASPKQTALGKDISNPLIVEAKVTKEFKFIKEKIKVLQYVWIHPPGVHEAQAEET